MTNSENAQRSADPKAVFYVKDPDVHCQIKDEVERQRFCDEYSEFGEYFLVEINLRTFEGRMLPRSEWRRYGR